MLFSTHDERKGVIESPSKPIVKDTISSKLSNCLPATLRLRKKRDFAAVQDALQSTGSRLYSKHFLLLVAPTTRGYSRLGITVTTKVDKRAVQRNRVKRCIREVFRLQRQKLNANIDLIVIARNHSTLLSFHDINREILGALRYGRLLA